MSTTPETNALVHVGPARASDVAGARLEVVRALLSVRRNLHELRADIDANLDWREQVRRHPYVTVGVALFFGLLLGSRPTRS